jgi:hypothetical protein
MPDMWGIVDVVDRSRQIEGLHWAILIGVLRLNYRGIDQLLR